MQFRQVTYVDQLTFVTRELDARTGLAALSFALLQSAAAGADERR